MSPHPTLDTILHSPACAADLPREALAELLAECAAAQSILVARLVAVGVMGSNNASKEEPAEGRMLTVTEACGLLRKQPRWIYRNAERLPFVKRLSRKSLLISEAELRRWLKGRRA